MFANRINIALVVIALNIAGYTQTLTNTDTTLRFKAQLSQQYTNFAWDAGEAYFSANGGQLQFAIFLDAYFSNFCSVALYTDSRQVVVQSGTGTFMYIPMCAPILVPGSDPPVYIGCYGLKAVVYFSGSIPLNATLLRELVTSNGEIRFYQPAAGIANGYWNTPPAITGRLLVVPGGDVTNALASLPRTPRSLSAVVGVGPVNFPFAHDDRFSTAVDVDNDGVPDFGLHGRTLCTMSVPADCTTMYGLSCASNSQVLAQGLDVLVVPVGTSIGALAPTNANWGVLAGDNLTSTLSGSRYIPWTGELGRLGEAYIGFKLRREDGDHYGWMRVRLPRGRQPFSINSNSPAPPGLLGMTILPAPLASPSFGSASEPLIFEFGPVVEDWAYEPTPNTPILAGARPFSAILSPGGVQRAGYLRMSFTCDVGRAYAVQFKPDLFVRGWTNLGWLIISTGPETVLDLPTFGSRGFYRVLEAD